MNAVARVEIVEIDDRRRLDVCRFLERWIDRRMTIADFSAALTERWADGPAGFVLLVDGAVAGALGTIRSRRPVGGAIRDVCNLTSFAVDPAYRSLAAALVGMATKPTDVVYTNFTPSTSVATLLAAFGFVALPRRERILLPLPGRSRRARFVTGEDVKAFVSDDSAAVGVIDDHRGTRTRWVGVEVNDRRCAVALHLMRARGVAFGHVLYCSAPDRFAASAAAVARACWHAWSVPLIAWPEWQFDATAATIAVRRPRPAMMRGANVTPAQIDGLYSELAVLPIITAS